MNKDKIPAAMYIRMSTEHQKYSPENQAAAIREYAECNNYEIIKTYTDGGKSGLNIAGRAALQQMLQDVQSHQAEYKAILVLDVTRWGRFQDADESAYYEYICKRAGTPVNIVMSSLIMTAVLSRLLLKTLNGQWQPNIAESFLAKSLPENAA